MFDPVRLKKSLGAFPSRRNGDPLGWAVGASELKPAAVLILLIDRPSGPTILLTERTKDLRGHPGQISLPGGRLEQGDPDDEAGALREAREEIALEPDLVEVIGRLPAYDTTSGYRIFPVVGWTHAHPEFSPNPCEVADLFELPLAWLLDRRNHRCERLSGQNGARISMLLDFENRRIWGATAAILIDFVSRIVDPPS
ncbi:8-oxo-dGTP pyrophosphatase MutT, NUDIX family [Arboricoccus pini]|uniref:8-oxo-dGTP pyrophosphatase MutT, NUDIX family n=1 Tax=Arboricoccus pini TaxID=1963835 RepID=A0A212R085_9PROT|nr:CoA pyrophosphatase [Arboricoccus pini]SNB65408.1 8-oxo-dGTP pyrophosphatase MutT, NUDIX family [Arboricoccus pini]